MELLLRRRGRGRRRRRVMVVVMGELLQLGSQAPIQPRLWV